YGELPGRDDALRLVADVQEDLVLVDLHHRALDDVAVVELDDRARDRVLEGHPVEVVRHHLPRGVVVCVAQRPGARVTGGCGAGLVGHSSVALFFPDRLPPRIGQRGSARRTTSAAVTGYHRPSATPGDDQQLGVVEVGRPGA